MSVIILPLTTPTLVLNPNSKRTKLRLQMQAVDVDANNSGKIFLGYGSQPVGTVGHQSQGEILLSGASIEQPNGGDVIDEKYKMAIWAVADTASQSLVYEEEIGE